MAVPELTLEERRAALEKAKYSRKIRAGVKAKIHSGELTLREVIDLAKSDGIIARMKVVDALKAIQFIGPAKADRIMKEAGIANNRRLKGLGNKQLTKLEEYFDSAKQNGQS